MGIALHFKILHLCLNNLRFADYAYPWRGVQDLLRSTSEISHQWRLLKLLQTGAKKEEGRNVAFFERAPFLYPLLHSALKDMIL